MLISNCFEIKDSNIRNLEQSGNTVLVFIILISLTEELRKNTSNVSVPPPKNASNTTARPQTGVTTTITYDPCVVHMFRKILPVLCRDNLLVHITKKHRDKYLKCPSAATHKHVKRPSAAADRTQCSEKNRVSWTQFTNNFLIRLMGTFHVFNC